MKTKDLALCALCAGLMAVCAWITLPVLEISFTMQTFAVFFTLALLGGRRGTISILVYLLLGAIGLPVFAGFRGGPGVLLGVTGGYILGFLASGLVYWLMMAWSGGKNWVQPLAMGAGMLVCYGFGSVWYLAVYLNAGSAVSWWAVLVKCVIPYLIPDALKITLACVLARRLKKAFPAPV